MEFTKMDGKKFYNDVNPVQFGQQACKKSHGFGPAIRTHWLIHFVVSGKGKFIINGHEHILRRDEMFIIPPFVETYYEADAEYPWEYIWIGFESESLPFNLGETVYCPEARYVFEKIIDADNYHNGRTEYLCARIFELFSLILESKSQKGDHVERALSIINSEYMNGLTVSEISEKLSLDRTYFSNLFSRTVGMSPKRYLTKIRMEQAAKFLTKYEYTVEVTALSVGCSDIYSFSKTFKAYYGVSPREFAKNNRNN